jgi:hypothetical protein
MMMLRAPHTAFNARMQELSNWMRSKHLKFYVRQQIELFYSRKLSTDESVVVDQFAILQTLSPSPIAAELVQILYSDTIKKVPIFHRLTQEVIVKLCLSLQPIPGLAGCPVIKQV